MKKSTFAYWLLAIATIHFLLGIVLFWPTLVSMFEQGIVATVGPDSIEHSVAFWFLMFAFPLWMFVAAFWQKQETVEPSVTIAALLLSAVGCVILPASGFWTLLILAVAALVKNKPETLRSPV
ncbi:hypothetical protein CS022_23180 [Veronia nyctiphanis]|uniref:Uncharacterized protein n=1 Tax=Veronia nyctiphanis TaxID=1278244 RepID=A0A4Q0YJ90_9GAMM|nr:DUF6463 family protein [Veronia nyctiphanis]RXJ70445.1 hypothetical protein CS022_23180 [Veronia nyctiphanis]